VPAFGVRRPSLLIVGLAPGFHGANRTGRPFTGDHAGLLLYATLHAHGFANSGTATARGDGLKLIDCQITNAVRCVPPGNRPLPREVQSCAGYLASDLKSVPQGGVILALGRVAHGAVLAALGLAPRQAPFAHHARHRLPDGRLLLDSYHCSRYNTQTGRLTQAMFDSVIESAARLVRSRLHR
jgi:uracil-DNA glycosylase